ncbi:MAG TPA: zinc-binding alcohol dehydrogenase [Anaerolineales bacterium]|nr:zinc-binding alcohol dehydrogenase [Anaerolineales bacterium]
MKRTIAYFTAPRQVELREESLPALGADDVLVETISSAISAGTEMLIYQGRFPRDLETDSVISALRGGFAYPLAYGYAAVGEIIEVGQDVNHKWLNQKVFSFQPHASHFITKCDSLFPIPNSCSCETACFLPNMETAVNFVQDGAPMLGERVLVFGQGMVGLLTASLLREFPLEALVTVDRFEARRNASRELGVTESLDPSSATLHNEVRESLKGNADLTYELSGSPVALDDAIALTTFSGRIVIGSWYGEKRAPIDFGGAFHRSRIKLISSQVSTIAPELSGRWDKTRRFEVAWEALKRIHPEKWITHRFPLQQAADAYRLLDEYPQDALQIVFQYRS